MRDNYNNNNNNKMLPCAGLSQEKNPSSLLIFRQPRLTAPIDRWIDRSEESSGGRQRMVLKLRVILRVTEALSPPGPELRQEMMLREV